MAGGTGSRLDADVEKPLYRLADRPMIEYVLDALAASRVEEVVGVVTPDTPETAAWFRGDDVRVVETPGEGYVPDLQCALETVEPPVLTVAADLPLLTGPAVDRVLDAHDDRPVQVVVPVALKRRLGVSVDASFTWNDREVAPAGINTFEAAPDESTMYTTTARYAVNVNRPEDARVAEAHL